MQRCSSFSMSGIPALHCFSSFLISLYLCSLVLYDNSPVLFFSLFRRVPFKALTNSDTISFLSFYNKHLCSSFAQKLYCSIVKIKTIIALITQCYLVVVDERNSVKWKYCDLFLGNRVIPLSSNDRCILTVLMMKVWSPLPAAMVTSSYLWNNLEWVVN